MAAGMGGHHAKPLLFSELLTGNAENVHLDASGDELHHRFLVLGNARRGMESDRIPTPFRRMTPGPILPQGVARRVGTVYFKRNIECRNCSVSPISRNMAPT